MNLEKKMVRLVMATIIIMLIATAIPQYYEVAAEFTNSQVRTDLTGINVAVYWGTALDSVVASKDALVHMYEWMNATVTIVNETQVTEGILEDYQILAMPGGNPVTFTNRFGSVGRAAIRDWVRRGGSYFGICGGAMFATRLTSFNGGTSYYQLNLFNGSVMGPIIGMSGMTQLHVNTSCSGPDFSDLASTTMSNYQGGGYYVADEGQEMITLATYDANSQASIVVLSCGSGTVCLSATHVELEENSDRDGTDYYDDDYNDPDSEWDLMLKTSIWQVESSTYIPLPTTTDSNTDTTNDTITAGDSYLSSFLPVIAASGVIAVVLIVGVFFKRR